MYKSKDYLKLSDGFSLANDREAKKLYRTNTYNIADKRACKRSSSVDKHSKIYKYRKFDRDYKYLF
jgi:hypothetical protein